MLARFGGAPMAVGMLLAGAVSPGTARAADPITIGFGMALTGGLAPNGKAALLAMQTWEEEINQKGGLLGRPVRLVYCDDQSNPANVPAIYTRLLDVDHVDLVVSGCGANGEWTEARVLEAQFQGVKGNGIDRLRDPKTEVVPWPPRIRTGSQISLRLRT